MGSGTTRQGKDDVQSTIRKRPIVEGGLEGGGNPAPDLCKSRVVHLIEVNSQVAELLAERTGLAWDSKGGRILILAHGAVLGFLSDQDATRFTECISAGCTYSLVWRGGRSVFIRKED